MTRIKLKLFVIGNSAISKRAVINLQSICSDPKLADLCDVDVVDLCKNKGVAEEEKILATPILIKKEPLPERRIIGDLSDTQKVISALEMD
ncbi:TPA: circadian clock protein KaiB [Legionella pneumophila]|uniref:circadian clock KaiB family protein n=1 Tax=Legionella sp. PATHC039 TaxID=2992042 RepID=UPI00077850CB|nr:MULTISPECIES: circadian clock KaiB family protein [Legionella]HAT8860262.1 circadian clock protein KaiB [Legionella pneumophila subsp. pneumophila]MCW8395364.1 circadian clock KaiB family protein [Legionella sp. PATHC039]HAT7074091.1 circadian clock protein KaiB [Legionella pneumophila]HAT8641326.1 circadian clock protein KaiB [Legionella pneumophila]HAT8867687.1 circadian clock protein KaiB [Legionella pneumophila subsp. pneumophila]